MNFDLTTLGATMDQISEGMSCSICNFPLGSEFVTCFSCSNVGHKYCFSQDLVTLHHFCVSPYCAKILNQSKICTLAQRGQKRQAEKMLSDTAKYLPAVTIGDNVRVSIPKVDRGKLGDKHLLGVITDISGIYYTIGTKEGVLNRKYTRGEFELWNGSTFLQVSDIPKTESTMHTIARSVTLGKRTSCQCRGKCNTNYCSCRRSGFTCSSNCHSKIRGKCNNAISPPGSPSEQHEECKYKIESSTCTMNSVKIQRKDSKEIVDISGNEDFINGLVKKDEIFNDNILDTDSSDSEPLIMDTGRLSIPFAEIEQYFASWGGCYKGINLCNTSNVDNFITLISLRLHELQRILTWLEITIQDDLRKIISDILKLKFDSLRFWLARKLQVKFETGTFDFFGSEYRIVQIFVNAGLIVQK